VRVEVFMTVKIKASGCTETSCIKGHKLAGFRDLLHSPMLMITCPPPEMAILSVSLFNMQLVDTGLSSVSIVSHQ
jgi:hypothetical protein